MLLSILRELIKLNEIITNCGVTLVLSLNLTCVNSCHG